MQVRMDTPFINVYPGKLKHAADKYTSIRQTAMVACIDRLALLRQQCHNAALHCAICTEEYLVKKIKVQQLRDCAE